MLWTETTTILPYFTDVRSNAPCSVVFKFGDEPSSRSLVRHKHRDESVKAIVKSMPDEMTDDWSDDETDEPLIADDRNYYKVEKWTKDGIKVDRMLYAGHGHWQGR
jgi:hypothetical protein